MNYFSKSKMDECLSGMLVLLHAAVVVLLVCGNSAQGADDRSDDAINKAYYLRMDGKVDEAKNLLNTYIASHPADAASYYELARIYCYMGPGDPEHMKTAVESAEHSIQKAVDLDSGNPIYRYFAARVAFFKAYLAMQSDQTHVRDFMAEICRAFEAVIETKPDYDIAMLNLIELYGGLPEELGRDSARAAHFEERLMKNDRILAGIGHCILMPENFDRIAYWTDMSRRYPEDIRILEELGKTCLREGKTETGIEFLTKAILAEPSHSVLYLIIANHHIMNIWQDETAKDKSIPPAIQALDDFLTTKPIVPLKAYALGLIAKLKYAQNKKEEGDKLLAEAKATDAYFSKASAIPMADLFIPPDQSPNDHVYLFQMF